MGSIPTFMRASAIAVAALIVGEQPASACISGPLPLDFIGNTSRLSHDGTYLLQHYGSEARAARLLIIFYKSDLPVGIARARESAVREYMQAIHRDRFTVIQSGKSIPRNLAAKFGYRVRATVEPTQSCG